MDGVVVAATCVICGGGIPMKTTKAGKPSKHRLRSKYCSTACRRKSTHGMYSKSVRAGLTTGMVGAMSELITCADLLSRGYYVFRSVSQDAPCDLIAMSKSDKNEVHRIEVTTGSMSAEGQIYSCKKMEQLPHVDIVVVVTDGELSYQYKAGHILPSRDSVPAS